MKAPTRACRRFGWGAGLPDGPVSWCLWFLVLTLPVQSNPALEPPAKPPAPARARFEVKGSPEMKASPASGRLWVILGPEDSVEPRLQMTETGLDSPPRLGRDVKQWDGRQAVFLDSGSALFPQASLGDVPAGFYQVQAVLATNRDLWLPDAPGNWMSRPQRIRFDPARRETHRLVIDRRLPDESFPADTEQLRFLKIRSERLSRFWGRPMFLRAGVILPRDWAAEPAHRYPLLIRIGGFGTRFDTVSELMRPTDPFRKEWNSDDAPRFVLLQLDGAGPLGDPYQINSDNHGPYGDALLEELLPYVEAAYRCVGKPHARVLLGGSTGGWVALALQVLYPEQFGGSWSGFPDPPDFRALQLVNLYRDTNAFVNAAGFERPCAREVNGDTQFTMRHETQLENVLGLGDSFVASGGQWGSWNATYSPRGSDGLPLAIWDPRTGTIDARVAEAWKRYDLRLRLQEDWPRLAPLLRGKIRIWMGDADTYFLDSATRLLDDFLKNAQPPAEARIEFAPREPHGWMPRTLLSLLEEMQSAVEANAPRTSADRDEYLRHRFGTLAGCPHCRLSP